MPVFSPDASFFPRRTLQESSPFGGILADSIAKRISMANAQKSETEAKYAERKTLSDILHQELVNKYYGPDIESQIGFRGAETNKLNTMTPLEAEKLKVENQYRPQTIQSEINYRNNLALGRSSTGSADEMRFHAAVKDYNPGLTPDQLREAADVYAIGGNQLSDGTPLSPMNPTLQRSYDRAFKSTTTSPLITQGVRANAAESEMPVLDKYITQGRKPYGTTIFGHSPQQIKDSLDTNNPEAQQRLGDYIASEVIAFDKAALQTRIAGTESGVTIINEAMQKARQTIDAKFPKLSDAARQRALETINKALREGLAARNSYGIGASRATGSNNAESPAEKKDNSKKFYAQTVGEWHNGKQAEDAKTIRGRQALKIGNDWYWEEDLNNG